MSEDDLRTYEVLLHRMRDVDQALIALAKRAARKGLPVLTWTWGKPVTKEEKVPHPDYGWEVEYRANVTRVPLALPCGEVKYEGWVFVAALQHLDGENIVRCLPGETLPPLYRSRGPVCDHCRAVRRRNDTYVVRHEDGRLMQVGSTCIADFLGADEAGKIASQATLLAEARGLAEGGCEGSGSGSSNDRTMAEYLPYVVWCVRTPRIGWVSRTKVRDTGEGLPTADLAWDFLFDAKKRREWKVEITDEDKVNAEAAESWAEALTDAEVDAGSGDYLHNLRAVARSGIINGRMAGIAASAVVAWQRAIGRARERAERAARPKCDVHLGNVGDKVTFGLPPKVGKKGQPLKGAPIVLSDQPVTLDFVTGYPTDFGYTTVLKFRTVDGGVLVWKASSTEVGRDDVGKVYTLAGTVKKHDDYKGEKQTIMSRCALVEVLAPAAEAVA